MRHPPVSFALVCALALPVGLRAQTAPTECRASYDACALRVERDRLRRGVPPGRAVGRLGLWGATALTPLVAGSDSAVAHAREFDRDYTPATRLGFLSGIAGGVLIIAASNRGGSVDAIDWGLLAGAYAALGVGLYTQARLNRAVRSMSRAIWWYNRDLPR